MKYIEVVREERDKFRAAAADSLLMRLGHKVEKPAPGADGLGSYTLRELARECLRIAGKPTNGTSLEMVARSMTSSDFPYILAAGANKSLSMGFDTASETWQAWCGIGSVPDFKTWYSTRPGEADDLDEVPEEAEYKFGTLSETREAYSVVTYGKLFAITRQAIINDDLSALSDIPTRHGEAAARKIGDIAYSVLTTNGVLSDGTALFDSGRGNYVASGAAPGVTTLAAGEQAMAVQTDLGGKRRLNIRPIYFLAPWALRGSCDVLFNSPYYSDSANASTDSSFASTRSNPWSGGRLVQVYEARLDAASTTAWYLAGEKGKTVNVYFLNGMQQPYLETREGWTTDGVEYKVRIDAGAAAVDYRALYCNAGA